MILDFCSYSYTRELFGAHILVRHCPLNCCERTKVPTLLGNAKKHPFIPLHSSLLGNACVAPLYSFLSVTHQMLQQLIVGLATRDPSLSGCHPLFFKKKNYFFIINWVLGTDNRLSAIISH
jgi:hypothetical protein